MSSKAKVKSPSKTPDKGKDKKKTPEKSTKSSSSRNATKNSSLNNSTDKSTSEARDDKFLRIVNNLQSDQLPSIRMKLRFEEEALKLVRAAVKSNRLQVLDLSGPGLIDATAKDLCALLDRAQLTYIGIHGHNFSPSALSEICSSMGNSSKLSTVIIETPHSRIHSSFGAPAHEAFKSVARNSSITSLKFTGHELSDNAAGNAAIMLQKNPKLLVLDLSSNPFGEEAISVIFKFLPQNTVLRALLLESVLLNDKCVDTIKKGLQHNGSLTRLSLSKNQLLTPPSLATLLQGFEVSKSLLVLELNEMKLGNEGAEILARLLQSSPLRRLQICDNHITKMDIEWEFVASLLDLQISGNPVGDAFVRRFARSVRWNRSLQTLGIQRCGVSAEALQELEKEIPFSFTLMHVSVHEDVEGKQAFSPATQQLLERTQTVRAGLDTFVKSLASPEVGERAEIPTDIVFGLGKNIIHLGGATLDDNPNVLPRLVTKIRPVADMTKNLSIYLYRNLFVEPPLRCLLLLSHVQLLDLSGNQIVSLPPEVGRLVSLTSLDVRANRLTALPLQMGSLTKLTHLYLQRNRLTAIPSNILGNCPLETLALDNNPISPVLERIYRQWTATTLDLSNSQVLALPPEICAMPKVRELLLANNQLVTLPQDMDKMSSLTSIDLSYNQIDHLPWQFGQVLNLRTLKLVGNPLKNLPEALRQNLTRGDVGSDVVQKLLAHLRQEKSTSTPCHVMKVMVLGVGGAGKSSLAKALVPRGSQMGARHTLLTSASGTNLEAPGVTRTGSLQQIGRNDSQGLESASVDVQLNHFVIRPEGATVDQQYEVWDFAGDERCNVSHAFFISNRSVYLLVFNAIEPLESQFRTLDYWMAVISSRAKGCPVLLVGTHADSKKLTPELAEQMRAAMSARYKGRFDSLSQIVLVSSKHQRGIPALLDAIQQAAIKQPCMGAPLPDLYEGLGYQLRNLARSLAAPIVSAEKFADIAAKCGIARASAPQALEALQDLGVVLFVRSARGTGAEKALVSALKSTAAGRPQSISMDPKGAKAGAGSGSRIGRSTPDISFLNFDEETTQAGIVVLDPLWLARVMRSFVMQKDQYLKRGVLMHSDVELIWRPPEHPPGVGAVYLDLLEKLEMTFPLTRMYREDKSDKALEDRSLVPMLLPPEPPASLDPQAFLTKEGEGLVFSRIYELDFLPQGLFAHLLVRALALARPLHYWRSGVIIGNAKQRIFAAMTTDDVTKIRISVTGPGAARLLLQLDSTVRAVMEHSFVVKPQAWALCTCSTCAAAPDAAFRWPLADLASHFLLSSQLSFKCGVSGLDVNLKNVAPDISLVLSMTLDFSNMKVGKEVGRGSYSRVYEAVYVPSGAVVAVKRLNEPEAQVENRLEEQLKIFAEFREEAFTWSRLHHPNILNLIGVTSNPLCFIIELAQFGSLHYYVRLKRNELKWTTRVRLAQEIAAGLLYLHTMHPPVAHRDIKSHNVLLAGSPEKEVAKLADFGSCFAGYTMAGRVVDNPVWLAPEVMFGKDYGVEVDIYSFGIVMYEIASSMDPFEEFHFRFISMLEEQILTGLRPTLPDHCPAAYAQLAARCWQTNPASRPSAQECVNVLEQLKIELLKLEAR